MNGEMAQEGTGSRPGSATGSRAKSAKALTRTAAEKEAHLDAARHLPGERPARGFRSLVEWLCRQHNCLLLEHLCAGPDEAEKILRDAAHVAFARGAVLFQPSDPNPAEAYILLDGKVSLHSSEVHSKSEADDCLGIAHHAMVSASSHDRGLSSPSPPPVRSPRSHHRVADDLSAVSAMNRLMGSSSPEPGRRHMLQHANSVEETKKTVGSPRSVKSATGSSSSQQHPRFNHSMSAEPVLPDNKLEEMEHGYLVDVAMEGSSLGELCLLQPGKVRPFTAIARSDVELFVISREQVKQLTDDMAAKVLGEKIEVLESNNVFQSWRWMWQAQLASHMTEEHLPTEMVVARQHAAVAGVYFVKSGQVRLQSEEKAEISHYGSSDSLRSSSRQRLGSRERLNVPMPFTDDMHRPPSRANFQFKKAKTAATLGANDIIGGYEVANGIANYMFTAQTLENTVYYEIPARKFLSLVKRYSRSSLKELISDGTRRYGLAATRMRKRSGSCPEIPLHSGRLKLPPLSPKTSPRAPLVGLPRSSTSSSPAMSRTSSAASSPAATPGTGTPRERFPALSSSRPESPLIARHAAPLLGQALSQQLSNLEAGSSLPTVVKSPKTVRKGAGRFDQAQHGRGPSPMAVRRATGNPAAHVRSTTG